MADYIIYTDSACDITPEMLKEWGVPCRSLTFRFEDDQIEHTGDDMDVNAFYEKTVLYISVSFAISYTRLLLPSF